MILPVVVLLVLLLFCGPEASLQGGTQEILSSDEILEREFIDVARQKHAAATEHVTPVTDRCSYTFIVPQQKNHRAICVNSQEPEALLENRVHKQDLELLNTELQKQRQQIEALQQSVEVDGGVVTEVKLLRKESRNMNSRVTQLYMQLLHEIIRKRDNALGVSQLEIRVLNHTTEIGRLAARYRDLEHKYRHLSALARNQSILLVELEERCNWIGQSYRAERERHGTVRPLPPIIPQPPLQKPAALLQLYGPHTNEIQSDQNTKTLAPPQPTKQSTAHSSDFSNKPSGPFTDCLQALETGHTTSALYLLKPDNSNRIMQVWCDQRHDPGGWVVIQRRQDGSVNFFRNWATYKQGFGNIDGEYWLGLENIHWLTNQGTFKLLVTLEDWSGRRTFAEYASFRIESEADAYRLRVGQYHGNAGDSLTWHNGKQFTTLDRDHDTYAGNCAHYQKGGWWYNACAHSNLNGVWYCGGHYRSCYQDGIYWAEFRGGAYSLKKVTMMIRPSANIFH
ncbi:angiopoietin-related protein 2-like [Thalassophryne amazonica]|uniref:angiopoietin-related protein 2-like n=1 Tax=Thalassophryne amazonica TaxID=390379 RepID=UPI001470A94A|nr:angiopoietin-related protein 2-like [Thalassophryne amazonica]